jgi:hypothetical protein
MTSHARRGAPLVLACLLVGAAPAGAYEDRAADFVTSEVSLSASASSLLLAASLG